MIIAQDLTFAYPGQSPILENINLSIPLGSNIALMGPNGSGKSTLALLIKGLLAPSSGKITVDGIEAVDDVSHFEIMKRVGLVFQNPENTIVTTTVETELAFGLENLGVPRDEMISRVSGALKQFDLEQYRHTNPTNLSGGEKQRLALASVMIMRPVYLLLDEPTSHLDPLGQRSLLDSVRSEVDRGSTVIHITQFSYEAHLSDRVIILDESGICADGKPGEVLSNSKKYRSCSIEFMNSPEISSLCGENRRNSPDDNIDSPDSAVHGENAVESSALSLEDVSYCYDEGTPFEQPALRNIGLSLRRGSSTVLLGASGSGKSTLLEIAAGITSPTGGNVLMNGHSVCAMAFQIPEDQMSGHTVESYIEFGPRNTGVPEDRLGDVIDEALRVVGLDPVGFRKRDPYALSGGEKRRVALAGVLAMKPDVLVLDEPTAGLDKNGMETVVKFLKKYMENGCTLLFSTHDFEVARCLCEHAAVLDKGHLQAYGKLNDVLNDSVWLNSLRN
ncbi:ABC transporter ATP-binding protein [Candidatus Latescibacterota bacterium]